MKTLFVTSILFTSLTSSSFAQTILTEKDITHVGSTPNKCAAGLMLKLMRKAGIIERTELRVTGRYLTRTEGLSTTSREVPSRGDWNSERGMEFYFDGKITLDNGQKIKVHGWELIETLPQKTSKYGEPVEEVYRCKLESYNKENGQLESYNKENGRRGVIAHLKNTRSGLAILDSTELFELK
jgi:hypothetical protein